MPARRFLGVCLLVAASLLFPSLLRPAAAQLGGYGLQRVILLPKVPESFDIGWVDAAAHRYYLADRTNAAVDVVDTDTDALVGLIGGFVGFTGKNATSG